MRWARAWLTNWGGLGWPVYDHALLERMAAEMRVQVDLLENVDERHVGWLVERMEDFSAVPYVSENAYVRRLIETLLALGGQGRSVIVGRGAAHVLPPTTTLRVRLVAELADRVRTLVHEMGLTNSEAARARRSIASGRCFSRIISTSIRLVRRTTTSRSTCRWFPWTARPKLSTPRFGAGAGRLQMLGELQGQHRGLAFAG